MRSIVLIIAVLGLAGCGGQIVSTVFENVGNELPASAGTATFDVVLVQSNFTAECEDPVIVDELFCQQVVISEMTAEGKLLTVPTTLNATATDRADAICNQLSVAHFDGDTGNDLGYSAIEVLDLGGDTAATCTVR